MPKDPQRKPRGVVGTVALDGGSGSFSRLELPSEKSALEVFVVDLALNSSTGHAWAIGELSAPPQQNLEDDIDFTLPTRRGTEKLELMEIAPLRGAKFSPGGLSYTVGERAVWITERIQMKAKKYGLPMSIPVHLLLYATHGVFRLFPPDMFCVAFDCRTGCHGFATIEYLDILGDGTAQLYPLYPVSDQRFEGHDVGAIRKSRGLIPDLSTGEYIPERRAWSTAIPTALTDPKRES